MDAINTAALSEQDTAGSSTISTPIAANNSNNPNAFSTSNINQDASNQHENTNDPETGGSNASKKEINIDELARQLESSIDAETKRYKGVVVVLWIVAIIFLLIWVMGLPLAIMLTEDWTYASAWYFSIQAGFGVGYGALTVESKGMEVFLIIHLFLGAISIAFLVAYLLSRMIDKADQKKKSKSTIVQEELGEPVIGWKSWLVGSVLLLLVMVMGVLYGILYEKWNFTESLYFIVSTCQTSGLLAPSIKAKDQDNIFAPLFVSLLVILAVPLWAYNIGKMSVEMVNLDRAQRRQASVMKRDHDTQDAFMRLAPSMGIDVSDPNDIQVSLAGFIVEWLLFDKLTTEAVIKSMIDEFKSYMEPGDELNGTVPQWKIIAKVRFLQLAQLGLLEREDWPAFCEAARDVSDKSIIFQGSSTMTAAVKGGELAALKGSKSKEDSIASKRS